MSAEEREEALRALFPLVKRLAARVHRLIPGSDRDDLVGDGCIGAIKAVDRFSHEHQVPLEHYAARVIVGAMLNGMRSMDTVPERVRREMRIAERERYDLASRIGRMPTQLEMEERRPHLRRAQMLAERYNALSLDCALPIGERLETDWSDDPARIAAARSERDDLRRALDALPPREKHVMTMHYLQGAPLRAIGAQMRISPQRASQLHTAAMRRLRATLHAAT